MKIQYATKKTLCATAIALACMITACSMNSENNSCISGTEIGVDKDNIEADARSFQKIPNTWFAQSDVGDEISALIFYPDDLSDAVYTIYLNRGGESAGYFFRAGGKIVTVKNGITRFSADGYSEFAYISLNKLGISRLEIDEGNGISTMEIDSDKPFALVLPSNSENVYFYNESGKAVEYEVRKL